LLDFFIADDAIEDEYLEEFVEEIEPNRGAPWSIWQYAWPKMAMAIDLEAGESGLVYST